MKTLLVTSLLAFQLWFGHKAARSKFMPVGPFPPKFQVGEVAALRTSPGKKVVVFLVEWDAKAGTYSYYVLPYRASRK